MTIYLCETSPDLQGEKARKKKAHIHVFCPKKNTRKKKDTQITPTVCQHHPPSSPIHHLAILERKKKRRSAQSGKRE